MNKEESKLNNCVGLSEEYETWERFITETKQEVIGKAKGWTWYGGGHQVNANYFVSPDGTVISGIFGYHARPTWESLIKNPDRWMQERQRRQREMDAIASRLKQGTAKLNA
jgi:hypothetical protein